MKISKKITIVTATMLVGCINFTNAGEVTITDEVIVKDCNNFGININKDGFKNPLLKQRLCMNFEGTLYQQFMYVAEENTDKSGIGVMFNGDEKKNKDWIVGEDALLKDPNLKLTIVSGPDREKSVKLIGYEKRKVKTWGNMKPGLFLKLDKSVTIPPWGGIICTVPRLMEGQLESAGGGGVTNFKKCEISHDVPPASTGKSSLYLNTEDSFYGIGIGSDEYMNTKAEWKIIFWAKGVNGNTKLKLSFSKSTKDITLTGEWKKYEIIFNHPGESPAGIKFAGNGVLIDDVEGYKLGDKNPSLFSDAAIDVLNDFGNGMPIRTGCSRNGSIDRLLAPRMDGYKHTSSGKTQKGPLAMHGLDFFPLQDHFEMCAITGNEPWYILPGIMSKKDMSDLMECQL